jgi:hypothetical protein
MKNQNTIETPSAAADKIAHTKDSSSLLPQAAPRSILYVLVNREGKVKTFYINSIEQNESDSVNLELFSPENLRGHAQTRLRSLIAKGYSLSNWHIVSPVSKTSHLLYA